MMGQFSSRIVAVASSAGDLEPLFELLSALPEACDAAFVVVQHLDPGREMLLAAAFAGRTTFRVIEVHDGVVPECGHVYVMRAKTTVTISGNSVRVGAGAGGQSGPADTLLISLAEQRGDEAVGVILSGGGSDGALGIRAIKEGGGTTFAQYPGSARFPSKPISAIETGCVDFVLRPNEIAHGLMRLPCYRAPLAGGASAASRIDIGVRRSQ
jgi:two-component system CheB/CheR fusion protein